MPRSWCEVVILLHMLLILPGKILCLKAGSDKKKKFRDKDGDLTCITSSQCGAFEAGQVQ